MGGTLPECDLRCLLTEDLNIIVVATQEAVHSIAHSLVNPSKKEWIALLQESFGGDFKMIISDTLNAMNVCVFVRVPLLPFVTCLQSYSVPVGPLKLPNKGCAAVTFCVAGTSFFLGSLHLSANTDKWRTRNKELVRICTSMQWKSCPHMNFVFDKTFLDRFAHVFLLGDFNYRVVPRDQLECQEFYEYFMSAGYGLQSFISHPNKPYPKSINVCESRDTSVAATATNSLAKGDKNVPNIRSDEEPTLLTGGGGVATSIHVLGTKEPNDRDPANDSPPLLKQHISQSENDKYTVASDTSTASSVVTLEEPKHAPVERSVTFRDDLPEQESGHNDAESRYPSVRSIDSVMRMPTEPPRLPRPPPQRPRNSDDCQDEHYMSAVEGSLPVGLSAGRRIITPSPSVLITTPSHSCRGSELNGKICQESDTREGETPHVLQNQADSSLTHAGDVSSFHPAHLSFHALHTSIDMHGAYLHKPYPSLLPPRESNHTIDRVPQEATSNSMLIPGLARDRSLDFRDFLAVDFRLRTLNDGSNKTMACSTSVISVGETSGTNGQTTESECYDEASPLDFVSRTTQYDFLHLEDFLYHMLTCDQLSENLLSAVSLSRGPEDDSADMSVMTALSSSVTTNTDLMHSMQFCALTESMTAQDTGESTAQSEDFQENGSNAVEASMRQRITIIEPPPSESLPETLTVSTPPLTLKRSEFQSLQLKVFSKLREIGFVNFPPTYKLVINSDLYNLMRIPSWTDRILYTSNAFLPRLCRNKCDLVDFCCPNCGRVVAVKSLIDVYLSDQYEQYCKCETCITLAINGSKAQIREHTLEHVNEWISEGFSCSEYRSILDIRGSDHRPVTAFATVPLLLKHTKLVTYSPCPCFDRQRFLDGEKQRVVLKDYWDKKQHILSKRKRSSPKTAAKDAFMEELAKAGPSNLTNDTVIYVGVDGKSGPSPRHDTLHREQTESIDRPEVGLEKAASASIENNSSLPPDIDDESENGHDDVVSVISMSTEKKLIDQGRTGLAISSANTSQTQLLSSSGRDSSSARAGCPTAHSDSHDSVITDPLSDKRLEPIHLDVPGAPDKSSNISMRGSLLSAISSPLGATNGTLSEPPSGQQTYEGDKTNKDKGKLTRSGSFFSCCHKEAPSTLDDKDDAIYSTNERPIKKRVLMAKESELIFTRTNVFTTYTDKHQ